MKVRFIYLFGILIALLFALRLIHNSRRSEGFESLSRSGADTFTLYYAEWCPHCQAVKPAFDDFAKNGFITIAGRNVAVRKVEAEKEPEKAAGKPIKGYPTFLFESADGKTVEYQGDRTPEGYMKFLEEQLAGLEKPQQ